MTKLRGVIGALQSKVEFEDAVREPTSALNAPDVSAAHNVKRRVLANVQTPIVRAILRELELHQL